MNVRSFICLLRNVVLDCKIDPICLVVVSESLSDMFLVTEEMSSHM